MFVLLRRVAQWGVLLQGTGAVERTARLAARFVDEDVAEWCFSWVAPPVRCDVMVGGMAAAQRGCRCRRSVPAAPRWSSIVPWKRYL